METPKTLKLKKPLNLIQQARLAQALYSPLGKEKTRKAQADNTSSQDSKNKEKHKQNKPPKKETSKNSKEALAADRRSHVEAKKKEMREAVEWLCMTYPQCFSQKAPRPLCIGILDILLKEEWPYTKTLLRKALRFYTRSPLYQKAILCGEMRYFLNGDVAQAISESEKNHARESLKDWKERKKAKREKNAEAQPKPAP